MIVFLKVTSQSGKPFGSLQMIYEVWPGGQISQNWEWIGANGTDDGGTWEWNKADSFGKVSVALNSNRNSRVISRMFAGRWNNGTFPPLTPWFVDSDVYDWENYLEHYGPDGNQSELRCLETQIKLIFYRVIYAK